ncbi:tRNA maturation protein LHP1 [Aspergillus clavatus NRRL 1]|uniref:RNA-binding La domain protein n=1 Tax=Aspergillus clavatus (strain ATCC 1007 / CBS 513.65 / DSM 816 / NCTC 3887 / NRRL 1 / QM 1276 / 107) TaxID=344612 RepID=A1CPK2_ASPCL|nr:RNA-binding La domain protein [Aspergillus clavatus NRRL 1]EAW07573.1 RNA-binding La domain protein [Aspergillus clavatus NRRL 1]
MSDEQKVAAPTNTNVESEKDVQSVLAELKGEAPAEQPAEEKKEASTEDAEEARIVAAAAKLGEQSEKAEEQKTQEQDTRDRGSRRNNVKFDPSTQEVTDNPDEIRKQVEFYFSDSNLPMDKFLLSKVGGSSNRAVPLELLHSFKRMRRFQPFSAIVEALKTSEAVELTDNDTCVRRKVPLPESVTENANPSVAKLFEDKAMSRSIYAKGFGEETPTTQLDIEAFFAPHGPTNAIRLRRTHDRIFKGSVFVEFASEEKQKEFLALDPKPQWKGQDLLIKSKKDYCEEKVRDIEAGRIKPSRGRGGFRARGRGGRGGRGRGGRGGDNRDWRERRADDQKKGFGKPQEERQEIQKDARGVPVVQSTADTTSGQKRTREDEPAANGDHPAKKVDSKE